MSSVPDSMARAEALLLGPGGPFEIEEREVLGEKVRLFKNRARSLREVLLDARAHGDAEYIVSHDGERERRITYAEHERRVASTAKVLAERYGVGQGDRVAILAANCPEFIVTFWATVSLGGIAVGLNGWWTGDEIRYGLRDCDPKALVADRKRLARLEGQDAGVPVVTIEDDFDELWLAHPDAALPETELAEDDACIILYTSGTTGRPKGVVHSHRNVCTLIGSSFYNGARTAVATAIAAGVEPEPPGAPPTILVTSPLFHVSGLHCAAITCLAVGAKSVWIEGRFRPELALRLIQDEKVNAWGFTAAVLHRLLHHPDFEKYDLSSFRTVGGGGSKIPESLQNLCRERIPSVGPTLGLGYGLTEGTAFTCLNSGEELVAYPNSAGRPIPLVDVEIRDESGRRLPDGEEGDIWVHGPLVMLEYWRNPDATAESIDAHRWLKTGDIGYFDGTRLWLSSRKRDLIIRGGENVYPPEIEHRLLAHPKVSEAAVVGVEHEELGQEVKAVVVPRKNETLSPEELTNWVAQTLAYFKVPAHWDLRESPLPRNATGKVLKHLLHDGAASTFIEE